MMSADCFKWTLLGGSGSLGVASGKGVQIFYRFFCSCVCVLWTQQHAQTQWQNRKGVVHPVCALQALRSDNGDSSWAWRATKYTVQVVTRTQQRRAVLRQPTQTGPFHRTISVKQLSYSPLITGQINYVSSPDRKLQKTAPFKTKQNKFLNKNCCKDREWSLDQRITLFLLL